MGGLGASFSGVDAADSLERTRKCFLVKSLQNLSGSKG